MGLQSLLSGARDVYSYEGASAAAAGYDGNDITVDEIEFHDKCSGKLIRDSQVKRTNLSNLPKLAPQSDGQK